MKKRLFCEFNLLKKINKFYLGKIKKINTYSRNSTILPRFVGLTIFVYNGIKYIEIKIKKNMIGHKLGEFSLTRKIK